MNNESVINDGGGRNRGICRDGKAGGNNKSAADGHRQQSTLSGKGNVGRNGDGDSDGEGNGKCNITINVGSHIDDHGSSRKEAAAVGVKLVGKAGGNYKAAP